MLNLFATGPASLLQGLPACYGVLMATRGANGATRGATGPASVLQGLPIILGNVLILLQGLPSLCSSSSPLGPPPPLAPPNQHLAPSPLPPPKGVVLLRQTKTALFTMMGVHREQGHRCNPGLLPCAGIQGCIPTGWRSVDCQSSDGSHGTPRAGDPMV